MLLLNHDVVLGQKDSLHYSNEIGLYAEDHIIGGYGDLFSSVGVKYERWHNAYFGYKILANITSFRYSSFISWDSVAADSIRRNSYDITGKLLMLGIGATAQHRVYKSLYVYASMELTAGYGKVALDTTYRETEYYHYSGPGYFGSAPGAPSNNPDMFNVLLEPVIGAKLSYWRVSIGIEQSVIIAYTNINFHSPNPPVIFNDVDFGNINTRLYVSYRFN